jgi:hypothetical protein
LSSTTYAANNEYKTISVAVSWPDASGASQTVTVEDAIGAIDPLDSAKLAKITKSSTPRPPIVKIYNPSGNGVIPIALGNGSSTAATNPTPEVVSRGSNNLQVVETRFNVLTYAGLSGTVTEQSRVETAIAGCLCDLTTGSGVGLRPTFWDGSRYTVPVAATFSAPAGPAVLTTSDPPQSRLCTACCRDHHDNSTAVTGRVTAGAAKFDPRRTTHDHYTVTYDSNNAPVFTLATDRYQEACRLIRVDGFFRVAADPYNDHMDILRTNSEATANATPGSGTMVEPTSTASTNYAGSSDGTTTAGFVKTYMGSRYVTGTAYNTPLAITATNSGMHQSSETMSKASGDYRWQHVRGLYNDYLEPVAINAINAAKALCDAQNTAPASPTTCNKTTTVLAMLPFTSVNLTEVAKWISYGSKTSNAYSVDATVTSWTPESTDIGTITNDDFLESLADNIPGDSYVQPARGNTLPGFKIPSTPTNGTYNANFMAQILESASGLALLADPLDPEDSTKQDNQPFIYGPSGTASATSGTYTVTIPSSKNNVGGYTFSASTAAYPRLTSRPNFSRCSYATRGGSRPNPFTCGNYSLGSYTAANPFVLIVSKYNYVDTSTTSTSALTCTGIEGDRTWNGPYPVNKCVNYGLTTTSPTSAYNVSVNGGRNILSVNTIGTDGTLAEYTEVTFDNLGDGDQIILPLRVQGSTTTSLTCTYQVTTAANGSTSYTYYTTPANCP